MNNNDADDDDEVKHLRKISQYASDIENDSSVSEEDSFQSEDHYRLSSPEEYTAGGHRRAKQWSP